MKHKSEKDKILKYFIYTYNPKNFSIKDNLTNEDIKITLYYKDKCKYFPFLTPR